jgi:hypothetical protein
MSDTMELHKGFFDRTAKRHYLSVNIADKIIANECGYCLVAYYQMRIGELLRAEKKYLSVPK